MNKGIRYIRVDLLKITQIAMAKIMKVNQGVISKYECGLAKPSIQAARRLIKYLQAKDIFITLEHIYND